ncbi:MAG TPA: hypothetical protein VIJ51_00985 [Solirubrobacteraceae bacterium]
MSEDTLTRPVHIGGAEKHFGEITLDEARARAKELKDVAGWGMNRVLPVARAWGDLVRLMEKAGFEKIADLDPQTLDTMAKKMWVIPPKGDSLI